MRWVLGLLLALMALPALADSWMPAERAIYTSANGAVRLTVEPRRVEDQLAYFEDKVAGHEPAGQASTETKRTAEATLERRVEGRWTTVWHGLLVNEVAPVSALVSDDGQHVATFDNWHSMGLGDNVVVVYGPGGALVRALRLDQILPADYVAALPRSVSSLHWSGKHRFSPDGTRLLVAVVVPDDSQPFIQNRPTVEIAVDLATGAVVPPSGPAWDHALAQMRAVTARRAAAEAAQQAAFVAPLTAPTTSDNGAWQEYLREAFLRTDPDWKRRDPVPAILRTATARDYRISAGWIREMLDGSDPSRVVMLAAPATPERLVSVVGDVARSLPTGKLRGTRVYLAVPPDPARRIAAALGPSGAEVVTLDLTRSIPQRPERLRGETPREDLLDAADDLSDDAAAPATDAPPRR